MSESKSELEMVLKRAAAHACRTIVPIGCSIFQLTLGLCCCWQEREAVMCGVAAELCGSIKAAGKASPDGRPAVALVVGAAHLPGRKQQGYFQGRGARVCSSPVVARLGGARGCRAAGFSLGDNLINSDCLLVRHH